MNTWDTVAASKRPYQVLTPPSVSFWIALALMAERNGDDLRDICLAKAAQIAEEKRHDEM